MYNNTALQLQIPILGGVVRESSLKIFCLQLNHLISK